MNARAQKKLKELLLTGWEIKGFQPFLGGGTIDDGVASETQGYTVLLQRSSDIAIAIISFDQDDGGWALTNVHMLTGAE